jgi:hypothetical protein
MNIQLLLKRIPLIIKHGTLGINANSIDRQNIYYKNYVIIIAHELRGHTVTAILTAFSTKRKV